MYIRTASNTLYIDVESEELEYFLDKLDIVDTDSFNDLDSDDIMHLLQAVCDELFIEHKDELTSDMLNLLKSFNGTLMAVEVIVAENGVTFKLSPKQNVSPNEYAQIAQMRKEGKLPELKRVPTVDDVLGDSEDFSDYNTKINSEAERVIIGLLKEFQHNIGSTCPTKKELCEEIDRYLDSNELLQEEYIDNFIKKCLKEYAISSPDISIDTLVNWLDNSTILYCYLVRRYLLELKKAKNPRSYDISKLADSLEADFEEKIREIYNSMNLEYFFKVKNLNDGLKAMPLVKEGCIIKIKDTYYLVTKGYNMVFIDFGQLVNPICYTEDSIICRIKNGTFNVDTKK